MYFLGKTTNWNCREFSYSSLSNGEKKQGGLSNIICLIIIFYDKPISKFSWSNFYSYQPASLTIGMNFGEYKIFIKSYWLKWRRLLTWVQKMLGKKIILQWDATCSITWWRFEDKVLPEGPKNHSCFKFWVPSDVCFLVQNGRPSSRNQFLSWFLLALLHHVLYLLKNLSSQPGLLCQGRQDAFWTLKVSVWDIKVIDTNWRQIT